MLTLAIESTAHTFGASVVNSKGKILSDIRDMYQTKKEGLEPRKVAEHHKNIGDLIIEKALKDSKKKMKGISFISFSQGPGLPLSLVEGMRFAKLLAKAHKKPLIGVNHICAHLEIGKLLTKARNPVFVFTSGANTQIIAHEGGKYRIFGECLSIALGNALDKFAREIGLGFPGGPKIEQLAKSGKKYIELPYVVKGMDVEFSGIVTHAINLYKKGVSKEDLCYSLQETMFAMLVEVTERALAHCDKNEVLLIGGVAANQRLCEMLNIMCRERKAKFYAVPIKYSGDNAAMIGWQGILEHKKRESFDKIDIKPNWRIDQVETIWIK
ncbi:tRNA (adenosine(37)-N6)-threonylcarbamoyltransferase complex transferase subunit TsaD [Candidatus Woesearchaeota archaeon]|nr:tRNA (adenosine(37)-N6)-threonylcarbamoyltransferase complex transferase subunit TsaD [Candidatus Woesearchaeota archaeon]